MTTARRRGYGEGSIYQGTDGRWVGSIEAGYTATGGRKRVRVTGKDAADVKRKLRDRKKAIEKAGSVGANPNTTVKAWIDQWLAVQIRSLRPKTYTGYASIAKLWIVPTIGHKKLGQLGAADVRAVADAPRKKGRGASTIRHTHTLLVHLLKDARAEDHHIADSVFAVDAPKKDKPDRGAIPIDQAQALLEVAAGDLDGSRWVAALLQGMRQGECLGLTWDCVDLDAGVMDVSWQLQALPRLDTWSRTSGLRVPDNYEYRQLDGQLCLIKPKTAKGKRLIPLVPWMTTSLAAWKELSAGSSPHGLVWPRPDGKPQTNQADRAAWMELQKRAGVVRHDGRQYALHEARHTTATLLMEIGVPAPVIIAILGHATITTSQGYMHADQKQAREAMEKVAQRLALMAAPSS